MKVVPNQLIPVKPIENLLEILSVFVLCITIFLQETWMAKQTLDKLTDISGNHFACGKAKVDYTQGTAAGRPYGGTEILWNK